MSVETIQVEYDGRTVAVERTPTVAYALGRLETSGLAEGLTFDEAEAVYLLAADKTWLSLFVASDSHDSYDRPVYGVYHQKVHPHGPPPTTEESE